MLFLLLIVLPLALAAAVVLLVYALMHPRSDEAQDVMRAAEFIGDRVAQAKQVANKVL